MKILPVLSSLLLFAGCAYYPGDLVEDKFTHDKYMVIGLELSTYKLRKLPPDNGYTTKYDVELEKSK